MRLRVAVLIVVLLVGTGGATCDEVSGVSEVNPSELTGKWVLESIDGRALTGGEIYFQIEGLNLSGFDGCNTFGGRLDAPTLIRISQRACEGDSVQLPLRLADPAAHLRTARRSGDRLDLPLWERPGIARFRRMAR